MFSTLHKMFTGKTASFLSMKTVLAVFMLMIGIGVNARNRTVTYDKNNGTWARNFSATSQDFDDGSSTTTYNLPTASNISRTGYTLIGWNSDKNGNGTTVTSETVITSFSTRNHTIYAIWGLNVTVKFNSNATGVSNPANKTVVQTQAYGDLPTVTRTGYRFDGWFTSRNGGSKITAETTVTTSNSQTLYAHWTQLYTITFNANEGVCSESSRVVASGEAYGELPVPTRTGYTFTGWYTSATGNTQQTATTTASANRTLYAHWTANTYTVSFDANAPQLVSPNDKTVTYDGTYSLPTINRPGYTFAGWWTSATGGTQIEDGAQVKITDNTTLYAHWTANQYAVSFDSNGGSAVSGITVTYDAEYGTLPTPTREAYVFAGWWTAAEGGTEVTALSTVDITAAQTLYAQWQERKMYIFANKVPNTNRYVTTFYDSKYAYTIPENVTAYTAVQNGNMFDLTPIEGEVIAKGEGVVLVTTDNGQYELDATAEPAEKIAENQLIGVDEDTQVEGLPYSDIFILSYTSQYGLGFYLLSGENLVANKAFFGTPSASAAKNFGFRFLDRGTTGINSVATETTGIRKIAGANGIVIEKDGKQYNVAGGRIK